MICFLRDWRAHLWIVLILNLAISIYTAAWFSQVLTGRSVIVPDPINTLLAKIIVGGCAITCIASVAALRAKLALAGILVSAAGILLILMAWAGIYREVIWWAQAGHPSWAYDSLWFILETFRMIFLTAVLAANLWLAMRIRRSRRNKRSENILAA